MMDIRVFQDLLTPQGREILQAARELRPTADTFLTCFKRLLKNYAVELVRAALTTQMLRDRAEAKFSLAGDMFFTTEALQQASSEPVADSRAARFRGIGRVADFCCGIGGDAIALSGVAPVTAVDVDTLRLAMARENATVYGRSQIDFREADLMKLPSVDADAYFFDPSRRNQGRRHLTTKHYAPSLDLVDDWNTRYKGGGVKVAPGVAQDELQRFDCEQEFISWNGELKDCVLWFGDLRTTADRRATVLPARALLVESVDARHGVVAEPAMYLYDPDPAVIRAGLVSTLAERINGFQIDSTIAYLTSREPVDTPFAKRFRIELAAPFHRKKLQQHLRERNIGRITIKRRGSPIKPAELQRQLKLTGAEHCVLFLTRVKGRPFMIVAEEVPPTS